VDCLQQIDTIGVGQIVVKTDNIGLQTSNSIKYATTACQFGDNLITLINEKGSQYSTQCRCIINDTNLWRRAGDTHCSVRHEAELIALVAAKKDGIARTKFGFAD